MLNPLRHKLMADLITFTGKAGPRGQFV